MNIPDPDDSVSRALGGWRVTPRRDPRFRTAVWSRIEAGGRAPSWATFARAHSALVAGAFALALVVGALGGRVRAQARIAADSDRLANSYVESMDARTMRGP